MQASLPDTLLVTLALIGPLAGLISNPFESCTVRAWRGLASPLHFQKVSTGFDITCFDVEFELTVGDVNGFSSCLQDSLAFGDELIVSDPWVASPRSIIIGEDGLASTRIVHRLMRDNRVHSTTIGK